VGNTGVLLPVIYLMIFSFLPKSFLSPIRPSYIDSKRPLRRMRLVKRDRKLLGKLNEPEKM
jgi:hypothetical protein